MKDFPLVSCIMPTYCRPTYARCAVMFFNKQKYPNKELIIIDDSPLKSKFPKQHNITVIHLTKQCTIGHKRNVGIDHSRGYIFINWDDDDYHCPTRIMYQVKPLLNNLCDITVLYKCIYFDEASRTFYKTSQEDENRIWYNGWICGTLACSKKLWKLIKFKRTFIGEDKEFLLKSKKHNAVIMPMKNTWRYAVNRHNNNTFHIPFTKHVPITPTQNALKAMTT